MNLEQTSVCVFLTCCKKQLKGPEDGVDNRRNA